MTSLWKRLYLVFVFGIVLLGETDSDTSLDFESDDDLEVSEISK